MYDYVSINTVSLGEGVEKALRALHEKGRITPCENQDRDDFVKEISLCLCVEKPYSEPAISKMMPSGLPSLVEYVEEMVNGSRDFEPAWEYTYHKLYSQYYDDLIEELKRNSTTRRAVVALGGAINFNNPHPPCLQMFTCNIRDGLLHFTVFFRSNDGDKAFAMNAFALTMLQKKIADELGVGIGTYTHIAESFHCYSSDYEQLEKYIELMDTLPENRRFFTLESFYKKQASHLSEYYEWIEKRKEEVKNQKND